MKKTKNPYHFLERYCLRTPTLPINFYKNIFAEEKHAYKRLKELWKNEVLKEAIFLASPYLYSELSNYFDKDAFSKKGNLPQTFLKYAIRASTRCTPFGLFAGVSVGDFNKSTEIELDATEKYKRITKYDTNYVSSLLNNYITNPLVRNQVLFFPNSTLYKVANQYRYIEYQLEKAKRSYSIEAVEHTLYLEKILKESKNGKTIHQLANKILDNDISVEDASEFIVSLIENQILVSELELNVTGNDSLDLLVKKLVSLNDTKQFISPLKLLQSHLTSIDKKTGNTSIPYQNCFSLIKEMGIPYEEKYVFQTDLFVKASSNTLAVTHGYTLKKLLPLLNKLSPLKPNKKLEQFKKAFIERYETREMPLAKVLDIELGIGYIQHQAVSDTTPFLEDILPQKKMNTEETIVWSEIDSILYEKLLKAESNNQFTIEITDKDFEHIESDWDHIPDTLSAFTEVLKIDNKECLVVHGLSANAGNLLARFSYGDTQLLEHLKQITDIEQQMQPDKIIAEIAHLPEARTGNILKRPHLRRYEIPYLAKSTLPLSQQITIDDLWASIQNNEIVLTSKRLNKEVIPRLTNAHNYELRALPIYHFLCDLQSQNEKRYLGFSWPEITEKHSFLPRVVYKGSILSKAKWHIKEKEIKVFLIDYHNEALLLVAIQKWRLRFQVPKFVQLVEKDNTLLIDLTHFDSVQLLLATIKNKKQCTLEEFLFTEETVVNRKNERFTNECIITLYNQEKLNQLHL
jgi:hypothetical protein